MDQTYMADLLQTSVDHALFIEDCFRQRSPLCDQDAVAQHIPPIQSGIVRLDGEIVRLDGEIARLKTGLSLLESHRDRLNHSIDKGRWLAFPPPVRKLPSEILASIFSFALPSGDGYNRLSSNPKIHHLPLPTPLLVSAVCSSWRDIALSTSNLWSAVSFELERIWGRDDPKGVPAKIENLRWITELFVTRARTSPLTLRFDSYSGFQAHEEGSISRNIDRVLTTLCQRSAQWFSVDFNHDFLLRVGSSSAALQSIKGHLPKLHKLSAPAHPMTFPVLTPIFADCPALRAIELHDLTDYSLDDLIIRVPWRQVEDLKLPSARLRHKTLELVSRCPNLTSFYYSYIIFSTTFANHLTSNMESLSLLLDDTGDHHHYSIAFFEHITLPRLSSLTLNMMPCESVDISPLLQCISRSSCPITTLTLVPSLLTGAQVRELFPLMPWLTTLTAAPYSICGCTLLEFLDLLLVNHSTTDDEASQHLLPRLRSLAITAYQYYPRDSFPKELEWIYDNLYKVVKSRWTSSREVAPQKSLRSIAITVHVDRDERWNKIAREFSSLKKLRELGEEGLEFSVLEVH